MNAPKPHSRHQRRAWYHVTLASLAIGTAWAAGPAPSDPAAPKTHVLFMGADIALGTDKEAYPVEEVTDHGLTIKVAGKPVKVPYHKVGDIRINEALKIARTNVEVGGLKAERAYTEGNDPFLKFARSATLAAGESAVADLAQGDMVRADMRVAGAGAAAAQAGNPEDAAAAGMALSRAQAGQAQAEGALMQALTGPTSQIYDVSDQSVRSGGEGLFDAIRFAFEVTPDRDLVQPYYVFIAQIRERDSQPGQVRKWAYVKSLGEIGAGESRKVSLLQGGMPAGYHLENYEVHVYDQGEEFATNLSRKRVTLTEDEALEYRIAEYIGANKGRTLPAALASTTLSGVTLAQSQLNGTYYVRVAKSGEVVGVFRDADGNHPWQDPALELALKKLRFKPALAAGKPVESVVPVRLDQLSLR